MDLVSLLYDISNNLSAAGDQIAQREAEFVKILEARIKGDTNSKRLSSQLIARFFKNFPNQQSEALNSLVDLCEDDDVMTRKQAIKDLPSICKDKLDFVPKVADLLSQLLSSDDPSELLVVNHSLLTVSKLDMKGFLSGLFSTIINGEDVVRERAIKFITTKMKLNVEESFTKEVQEYFLQEVRQVMQDVTKDEFIALISFLNNLKICKQISGQQVLIDMITEQADLDRDINIADQEGTIDSIDRLVMCSRHAMPFFSQFVCSSRFVNHICTKVLPLLSQLQQMNEGVDLDILQVLAEMSPHISKNGQSDVMNLPLCQGNVMAELLKYLPSPPEILSTESSNGENSEPGIKFTHVECLMFTLYNMGKVSGNLSPTFETNTELSKEFRLKIQYLARRCQNYARKLQDALKGVSQTDLCKEENRIKQIAVRTTNNLSALIKDMFKTPPQFKASLTLSWKPVGSKFNKGPSVPVAKSLAELPKEVSSGGDGKNGAESKLESTPAAVSGTKRKPIMAPEGVSPPKEAKTSLNPPRDIYAPPSGKFSGGLQNFVNPRGQFRQGGFRGGRGRGFRGGRGQAYNRY